MVLKFLNKTTNYSKTWKIQYGKEYGSNGLGEVDRLNIWMDNTAMIERHNQEFFKGQHSFTLKMNKFGDLTNKEFNAMMNGYKRHHGTASYGNKV